MEAHESEISRLEVLLKERRPILHLIEQFNELQNEEKQLEASTQDASRLLQRGAGKRDPTRLLREEKMRKRLAKRKPIVLHELKKGLEAWEDQTGKPFLINGKSFNDILELELEKVGAKKPVRKPLATPSQTPSVKPSMRTGPLATPRQMTRPASPTKLISRSALAKQAMPPPSVKSLHSPSKLRTADRTSARSQTSLSDHDLSAKSTYMDTPSRSVKAPLKTLSERSRSELGNYPNLAAGNRPRSVMGSRSPTFNSGIARLTEKANGKMGGPSARTISYSTNPAFEQNRSATSLGTYQPASPQKYLMTSPSIYSTPSSRTISTNSTTGSENWKSLDEMSSSEDEFDDPIYVKWREEAMKRLETPKGKSGFHRSERVSEFNWDKDTF